MSRYTLLDFSEAMLALSRSRLSRHQARTRFVRADFKSDSWSTALGGPFDLVLSLQAVHELRHKRHAARLYSQIRTILSPTGALLVCDPLPESAPTARHRLLYLTPTENLATLANAGFSDAEMVWSEHAMALYRARA